MDNMPPFADRARQWNVYCDSTLPYRAQLHPIPPHHMKALRAAMRTTFGSALWGPWWICIARHPVFQHRTAPR
eukprot:2692537-Prorocentrum_lima.AAC.1